MALYPYPPRRPPPQLPPLRALSFYPPAVSNMALTSANTAVASPHLNLNRPLPRPPTHDPIPSPGPSRPNPPKEPLVQVQPNSTHRPLSAFHPRIKSSSLLSTLDDPGVLASLIAHLHWSDVYSFLTTCKMLHDISRNTTLRDVILARFLPGYASCLRKRDRQFYQDIPVTLHDLDLLLISQRVPLHRYPTHALRILTSLYPSMEDDELRAKLVTLTQAHSRFVLLLQSLAHSSTASLPQETEDFSIKSRFSPIQALRELTFPPPLSYSEQPAASGPTSLAETGKLIKHARHKSAPSNPVSTSHAPAIPLNSPLRSSNPLRPSADGASLMMSSNYPSPTPKKGGKLTIFGKRSYRMPSPPPPVEPRALKMYTSSWRKSSFQGSFMGADFHTDDSGYFGSTKNVKRPQRRFASGEGSSDSSLSNSSPLSMSRSRNSFAGGAESQATSTHDLILATSRVRAPILRIFVPCTKLEDQSESLLMCEQLLVESGLWDHLSTGDIICNLGYVPPIDEGSSEGDDPTSSEPLMMRRGSSNLANSSYSNTSPQRKWLLFNGNFLVPYTPPDLLPLDQPLNLPTPFYYAHIMPAFTNLSYIITQLPVCDDVPQLTLMHSTRKLPSPNSPNGFALVKKYAWTARVVRLRTGADGEMGEGWFGEWILEGEGTREGKQLLLDALRGYSLGHREWELVREKSGAGKLWLRLLTI